jgi:hypothetical protein
LEQFESGTLMAVDYFTLANAAAIPWRVLHLGIQVHFPEQQRAARVDGAMALRLGAFSPLVGVAASARAICWARTFHRANIAALANTHGECDALGALCADDCSATAEPGNAQRQGSASDLFWQRVAVLDCQESRAGGVAQREPRNRRKCWLAPDWFARGRRAISPLHPPRQYFKADVVSWLADCFRQTHEHQK